MVTARWRASMLYVTVCQDGEIRRSYELDGFPSEEIEEILEVLDSWFPGLMKIKEGVFTAGRHDGEVVCCE
jgi:hypothetical protein